MDDTSSSAGILVRAALIIPAVIAVARTDFNKFRAWRARSREWRRGGLRPPPEYERDNRLWRWRLGAFALILFGFGGFNVALWWLEFRPWVIWPLYAVAMIGACAWYAIGRYVR